MKILFSVLLLGISLHGQTARVPSSADGVGVIEGFVRNEISGQPIPDSVIALRLESGAPPIAPLTATSDNLGRFRFEKLPSALYTIQTKKAGFFGQRENGGSPPEATRLAQLTPTRQHVSLTLTLVPQVEIRGRIRTTASRTDPVSVEALILVYRESRKAFRSVKTALVDQQGEFALPGLPPATYYLRAQRQTAMSSSYFPGVFGPSEAQALGLRGGETRIADFELQERMPLRISGTVAQLNGTIPRVNGFILMPVEAIWDDGNSTRILPNLDKSSSNGHFEILAPGPGRYDVMPLVAVNQEKTGAERLLAGLPASVTSRTRVELRDRDLDGVLVHISPQSDVEIQFVMNTPNSKPWQNVRVSLKPRDQFVNATINHLNVGMPASVDGKVKIASVPQGKYVIDMQRLSYDVYISDIRQGSRSIYNEGTIDVGESTDQVQIFLSEGAKRVSGVVSGNEDVAPGVIQVTLIPSSEKHQNPLLYRRTTTGVNGTFNFFGLAPGEYKVFAWKDLLQGAELNSEFRAANEQNGLAVSVRDHVQIALPLVPLEPRP